MLEDLDKFNKERIAKLENQLKQEAQKVQDKDKVIEDLKEQLRIIAARGETVSLKSKRSQNVVGFDDFVDASEGQSHHDRTEIDEL